MRSSYKSAKSTFLHAKSFPILRPIINLIPSVRTLTLTSRKQAKLKKKNQDSQTSSIHQKRLFTNPNHHNNLNSQSYPLSNPPYNHPPVSNYKKTAITLPKRTSCNKNRNNSSATSITNKNYSLCVLNT